MSQQILQWIVGQTAPARPPRVWRMLSPVPNVRVLSQDPPTLDDSFFKQFSPDELAEADVMRRDSESKWRTNPVMDFQIPFKVLSRNPNGPPSDFEFARGRLTRGEPAALRCLDDQLTRARCAKRKYVLATFSNFDLAVLSMLGLPATPGTDLCGINADQAKQFFATHRASGGIVQDSDGSPPLPGAPPKIILVAFNLSCLHSNLPEDFWPAFSQLYRIESTMQLPTASRLGIWLPGEAELRRIRDTVALADVELVLQTVLGSVERSLSLEQCAEHFRKVSVDKLPEARQKLIDDLNSKPDSPFGTQHLPDLLERLKRAAYSVTVDRAYTEAAAAEDPIDSALLTSAAGLMEMQFRSNPLVRQTEASIATNTLREDNMSIEEELQLNIRTTDTLIKIKKALEKKK